MIALLVFGNQGFLYLDFRLERAPSDRAKPSLPSAIDHERLSKELSWIQKDPTYNRVSGPEESRVR